MRRIRDHQTSSGDRSTSSPGPIGGAGSYGMDKDTFNKSIGRDRDRDRDRSTPATKVKQDEPDVVDKVVDWFSDKVTDVGDWFTGKEDTSGFSPMGGPSSYGMETKKFDETIGSRRHESRSLGERMQREVKYVQEAPLDYAADFLDNPLVSAGMAFSGLGMTAFGVKAMDAVADYFQREESPINTVKTLGGQIVESTPVGQVFGPLRNIVASGIKDTQSLAPNIAGFTAASVGGELASTVSTALTDNPYARAALTAGGAMGAGAFAKKAVKESQAAAPKDVKVAQAAPRERRDRDRGDSPLVSSGKRAVAASEQLMQPAPVDLYAQTVKQLPFYGLDTQQLPYYRV